jgi:hypothetical protein
VTGDPISDAASWAAHDSKMLMALVAKLVRYHDYFLEMKLDRFNAVLHLALMDQFGSFPDKVKARKLSSPSGFTFTEPDVEKARQSPEYARIHADVLAKAQLIAEGNLTVDRMAELLEDANTWELFRIAQFAPSPRDRKAALEEFTSRRSAKKGRENQGREMILPERFIETMVAGLAAVATAIQGHEQERISGAKLNVPRLVGEGRVDPPA